MGAGWVARGGCVVCGFGVGGWGGVPERGGSGLCRGVAGVLSVAGSELATGYLVGLLAAR